MINDGASFLFMIFPAKLNAPSLRSKSLLTANTFLRTSFFTTNGFFTT